MSVRPLYFYVWCVLVDHIRAAKLFVRTYQSPMETSGYSEQWKQMWVDGLSYQEVMVASWHSPPFHIIFLFMFKVYDPTMPTFSWAPFLS
jgi:hypothetical protein